MASQVTLLVTFLPAMMLSGFLFDLRSMPAVSAMFTYALPARYFVALVANSFSGGRRVGRSSCRTRPCWSPWRSGWLVLTRRVTRKRLA